MFENRSHSAGTGDMPIDKAEAVAQKLVKQIGSEDAEAIMS